MPHTVPTVASIKARFPEFDGIPDARIGAVIEEVGLQFDTGWPEAEYTIAYRYLVAHTLVAEGALNGGAGAIQSGPVVSESLGDASVTYAQPSGGFSLTASALLTTEYGKRYVLMRNQSFAGPLVL